jgi:hypothetical protein
VSQSDWDRLLYYSRKVKFFKLLDTDNPQVHPSTYVRIAQLLQSSSLLPSLRRLHYNLKLGDISHIFLFQSPLLDSLELTNIEGFEKTIVGPFLATSTLSSQMLTRIVLDTGRISVDILKKNIIHFKQLRLLELSVTVFMSDFTLWEVLGTLPALTDLTLKATDPASYPADTTEDPNSQGGGPKYFNTLDSLCVTGSFFFIQHLLGFIDSPCLTTIKIYPVITTRHWLNHPSHDSDEPDNHLTPSITIVASKWSQSLKTLFIDSSSSGTTRRYSIPKCLMLLSDLHEMQTFFLMGWSMENMEDDVRCLVTSWPKLTFLRLPLTKMFISLSTLRIIAENCPELRYLQTGIRLEPSTIPPFDTSSKSLRHKLEILTVGRVDPFIQTTLGCQIQVARHLNLIFPYLKSIRVQPNNETWFGIYDLVKLCQEVRQVQYY